MVDISLIKWGMRNNGVMLSLSEHGTLSPFDRACPELDEGLRVTVKGRSPLTPFGEGGTKKSPLRNEELKYEILRIQ